MENLKFKTTIKCEGCLAKVTANLNETAGEGKWHVDLDNPSKVLTINTEADANKIKGAVEKAGFKAELI